jgi:hypothetical protein
MATNAPKQSLPLWNFRKWGTATDPIHKSDLNKITGDYGCDAQFRRSKDEAAAELAGRLEHGEQGERALSGKAAAGTAVHETMARALGNAEIVARLLDHGEVSAEQVGKVYREEFEREVNGREVAWYKDRPDKLHAERVAMIVGVLNRLAMHVAEVLMVEPAFIVRHPDGYWLSGHVDLIYRPRANPLGIGMCDWKTGSQKPHQIELDHGWEAGIYSLAIHSGHFLQRSELVAEPSYSGGWSVGARGCNAIHASKYIAERRAAEAALSQYAIGHEEHAQPFDVTFGAFPDELYHVHMHDYVPYEKAGDKEIKRPEDCKHWGVERGSKVKYIKGQLRGGAWCEVQRTEHDIPRLGHQLRNVVGTVRMGRFAERVGERCEKCPYKGPCLAGGYELRGDDARALEKSMRDAGVGNDLFDGLDEAG